MYFLTRAILELLTKKSNAKDLITDYSNALIQAAKLLDKSVIGAEAIEQWQRLKVYGMSPFRYFGKRKIELFCCKIEASTRIKLKTISWGLINKA